MSKIKFKAHRTESWHRALGIRYWNFQKDWQFEISLWFFDIVWSHDEQEYPF